MPIIDELTITHNPSFCSEDAGTTFHATETIKADMIPDAIIEIPAIRFSSYQAAGELALVAVLTP